MNTDSDWIDAPDEDDDVISGWGVPLHEPPAEVQPTEALSDAPAPEDLPTTFLLGGGADGEPGGEFHPHLRRFGEAS